MSQYLVTFKLTQYCIVTTSGTRHRSFLAYMASQTCVDHDVLHSGVFERIDATKKHKASVAMDFLADFSQS